MRYMNLEKGDGRKGYKNEVLLAKEWNSLSKPIFFH